MLQDLKGPPANPSSVHFFGQRAKKLLAESRAQIASYFGAKPEEIIFTSGGTESLNLLLKGLPPGHLITTDLEHSAVYKTALELESKGRPVTFLSCGLFGAPTPSQIENAILPNTKAILLSASNGETGVKIDLEEISKIAEKHAIPLFLDAVAFIGKEKLHLPNGVKGVASSAHKFHGPKGIGLLYLKSHTKLSPLLNGGGQEYHLRAGTENLAGILGLAESFKILKEKQEAITKHIRLLQHTFETTLLSALPNIQINGTGPRICNTSNIAFLGTDGETLLLQLDLMGVAASHGSACASGALEPSRILTNMGIDRKTAKSSLRFSFSRENTLQEIEEAASILISLVKKFH